ncbi:unnamed protein product [Durusdinium trenchii]|uniref:Glycosyl transferase family 25 domain-containing protein n=1 Tax=Durusdinium trenchii TaxID=1381693 RepID=A0ABP0LU86_9DINO
MQRTTLNAGGFAILRGLKQRTELNGQRVLLIEKEKNTHPDRWLCRLNGAATFKVRQRHLHPCPTAEEEIPKLGPTMKTFVINLARRPDRRASIEELCKQLDLSYQIVEACDGQELAQQDGAYFEDLRPEPKAKASSKASRTQVPKEKVLGFQGVAIGRYKTHFNWKGRKTQLLQMAKHRLRSSRLTRCGHELWGAVGCSISHQIVLQKILADPKLEYALVLEDDCILDKSSKEVKELFDSQMRWLVPRHPDWQLIYLGGTISSSVRLAQKEEWRLNDHLLSAQQVYQTHAFVIRRSLIPTILHKLSEGFAADAAFVSWSRQNSEKCFLFQPQLLKQPGGENRWKDSDIFVEGTWFKKAYLNQGDESEYDFAKASKRRCSIKHLKIERKDDVDAERTFHREEDDKAEPSKPNRRPSSEQAEPAKSAGRPSSHQAEWAPGDNSEKARKALAAFQRHAEDDDFAQALPPEIKDELQRFLEMGSFQSFKASMELLVEGASSACRLHRAALRGAVSDAVEHGGIERVRTTVKCLSDESEASGWQSSLCEKLACTIRCFLEFHFGLPEQMACKLEAAVRHRPLAADDARQLEAIIGVGPRAALGIVTEATILPKLFNELKAAGRRFEVAEKAQAELLQILGQVPGASASSSSSSLNSPVGRQEESEARSASASPSEDCSPLGQGRLVRKRLSRPAPVAAVDVDPADSGKEGEEGEEPPLKVPKSSRRGRCSTAMREELLPLSVRDLRAKAKTHGVPCAILVGCIEKADLVEALVQHLGTSC